MQSDSNIYSPPNNEETEGLVLGACLLERDAIEEIINILTPEMFYSSANGAIYKAILDIHAASRDIDIISVSNKTERDMDVITAGGMVYITRLTSRLSNANNILTHALIVQEKYLQREVIRSAYAFQQRALIEDCDIDDLLSDFYSEANKLSELNSSGISKTESLSSIVDQVEADLQERTKNSDYLGGVTTGLTELDDYTDGWQKSDLIILAARPSMGKTALMLEFAIKAYESGCTPIIYSLEMDCLSLTKRLALKLSGADATRYRNGQLTPVESDNVVEAFKKLKEMNVIIDDSIYNIDKIAIDVKRRKKINDKIIVFIDYLQNANDGKEGYRNRESVVSSISRKLKRVAKENKSPVIALSQLNRAVESRAGHKPGMADLRESGAIEQDADVIIFVWRPEQYGMVEDEEGNDLRGKGALIIAKQRNGKTGMTWFSYNDSMTVIKDRDARWEDVQSGIDFGNDDLDFNTNFDNEKAF